MGGHGRPGRETGGGFCACWMICFLFMPLLPLITGCATFGSSPVYGDIPECERLIPPDLKKAVASVAIPDSEDAQPWMQAFVGQTGQLDKANDRTASVDYIYSTCLKMHRDALAKAKRGFFGRIFG